MTPQWQTRQTQRTEATRKFLPVAFIAGILALLLGGTGLAAYARSNSRDLTVHAKVVTATPPGNVPPAIVGKLTAQASGFMGTIFDLAQRGVLEVREEKGFWGTTNHILERKGSNIALRPHEQGLLDAIFKTGETQIHLNEVGTRLRTTV